MAVTTGVVREASPQEKPANIRLKVVWLYQFAYVTIKTQEQGFEPRQSVLETEVLPLHHSCLVAVAGLEPAYPRL